MPVRQGRPGLAREEIRVDEVRVPQRRSRRPEVEALTGQRRVPVLVIDGKAICDSRRIVEYLEYRRSKDAGQPPSSTQAPR